MTHDIKLALLVAFHSRRGASSHLQPYIASLPRPAELSTPFDYSLNDLAELQDDDFALRVRASITGGSADAVDAVADAVDAVAEAKLGIREDQTSIFQGWLATLHEVDMHVCLCVCTYKHLTLHFSVWFRVCLVFCANKVI
jgi:hypothetical protein